MRKRKKAASLLLAVLLACALLSGCLPKNGYADGRGGAAWGRLDAQPEFLTQWPDNVFTEKIAEPQSGTIDYVLDDSDAGRYAVFISGISAEACGGYIGALKGMGYSEICAAGNEVSVGTMLEREDAYLSVSYAEGVLGVLITLKEPN